MRQPKKVAYLTPETHAALMAFCKQRGYIAQVFVDKAINDAIARHSIARRWDGEQWVNYEVVYPLESEAND
jgi:hypothetical protein